jgi:hypothetical protein
MVSFILYPFFLTSKRSPSYSPLPPTQYDVFFSYLIIRRTDIKIVHISVVFLSVTYYNSLPQTFIQKCIFLQSMLFYFI